MSKAFVLFATYTIIKMKQNRITICTAYDNTILHTTYTKPNAENVNGLCVTTLKIKTALCPSVNLGDCVDPLYDKYGNVAHLSVTPKK